jgi:hypothetical protein
MSLTFLITTYYVKLNFIRGCRETSNWLALRFSSVFFLKKEKTKSKILVSKKKEKKKIKRVQPLEVCGPI